MLLVPHTDTRQVEPSWLALIRGGHIPSREVTGGESAAEASEQHQLRSPAGVGTGGVGPKHQNGRRRLILTDRSWTLWERSLEKEKTDQINGAWTTRGSMHAGSTRLGGSRELRGSHWWLKAIKTKPYRTGDQTNRDLHTESLGCRSPPETSALRAGLRPPGAGVGSGVRCRGPGVRVLYICEPVARANTWPRPCRRRP